MQPRFHFNTATHGTQPDQYDADRALFLQYYMIIAEEFLYAFLEAWHGRTLANLNLFRDSSELAMDEQLYLGADCLDRLCQETSQINANYVEVMPSKEGFDIGVALAGDLKVRFRYFLPLLIRSFQPPLYHTNFHLLEYPLFIFTQTSSGLVSTFSMEIVLKNDGAWYIYSMKAV